MEQILGVANRALEFRQQQKNLLHDGQSSECNCNQAIAAKRSKRRSTLGDVTTVNLTMIKSSGCDSGAYNVIPTQVQAGFDIRISPNMSPPDMTLEINKWCQDAQNSAIGVPAGYGGVTWEYVNTSNCQTTHAVTSVSAAENPWWDVFQNCIQNECNTELTPLIFPAATDSRFLRALGIRAFGFSPIKRSPILLHEHDEYLSVKNYFEGCDVYVKLIKSLSSQNRLATDM
jgi:aminoacylase